MSSIDNVVVLGMGVLGSQIAFQSAYFGKEVTAYDISDEAVAAGRERFATLATRYAQDLTDGEEKAGGVPDLIRTTSDLAEAVRGADLVIEAVPEALEIKQATYRKLAEVADAGTVFATNSSTLLPSDISPSTGRPERFLALHFANEIWLHNTAEVMPGPGTDASVVEEVTAFAEEIGMVPIVLRREKSGYVLNSLLVPLLDAAAELWVGDYADIETVDKTWRLGTGAPAGPFQIYDVVGLTTAYNIASANPDPGHQAFAARLKAEYIDQGKLGVATGEGFYKYG
ncbi:3-hydroxyacyl-CoA dehydrogenase [Nocardioides alcanivorans]|uniref:3-hydroxyacyl-CoA dehydrogenase n=1 Tax=Nocardioides alcanivorans TaxID=2897352 RepID=UPI001F36495B|nr:3-hydroxyacyl-CoA dehydrogenase [Nocardioides alcanivorans]